MLRNRQFSLIRKTNVLLMANLQQGFACGGVVGSKIHLGA